MNKSFTYSNLKNRLKVLKKTFNLYYNLANRSGWGWDPVLKVPTYGDEQMWEEIISVSGTLMFISKLALFLSHDINYFFLYIQNRLTSNMLRSRVSHFLVMMI